MIDLDVKLSPHFTLREMCVTSHRHIRNVPTVAVVERLKKLCSEYLEPIRVTWGPLWVTSGYRYDRLNEAIGGAPSSAHIHGLAADFVPVWGSPTREIVEWIAASGLQFDQLIDEYSSTANWIHIGAAKEGARPRGQVLTKRRGKYSVFQGAKT